MSRPGIANDPTIVFADRRVRLVFDRIVAQGVCVDDELEASLLDDFNDMTAPRVRALYSALRDLGLVEIEDTLDRGARIIKPTRRGIALARSLR